MNIEEKRHSLIVGPHLSFLESVCINNPLCASILLLLWEINAAIQGIAPCTNFECKTQGSKVMDDL